jgi:tRNA (cytidine/uridine-2'-O-)-methyltransferase
MHVILFEPEIPPNTGNIIRLCANTGSCLHLIKPLGFTLNDSQLKRAGLDYHEFAKLKVHENFDDFVKNTSFRNLYACSTKGKIPYSDVKLQKNDAFLFGPETRGLPAYILQGIGLSNVIRIPMVKNSRSLNLSNAVAVILYEALRQSGFCDLS